MQFCAAVVLGYHDAHFSSAVGLSSLSSILRAIVSSCPPPSALLSRSLLLSLSVPPSLLTPHATLPRVPHFQESEPDATGAVQRAAARARTNDDDGEEVRVCLS